jgi:hypothetical protein
VLAPVVFTTVAIEECSEHDYRINHWRLAAFDPRPVGG